jgi:hypothetical protein
LWTTFNRVQENIIRGGLSARTKQGKSTRTRVTGMDKDTSLNRALWILSERMNELSRLMANAACLRALLSTRKR